MDKLKKFAKGGQLSVLIATAKWVREYADEHGLNQERAMCKVFDNHDVNAMIGYLKAETAVFTARAAVAKAGTAVAKAKLAMYKAGTAVAEARIYEAEFRLYEAETKLNMEEARMDQYEYDYNNPRVIKQPIFEYKGNQITFDYDERYHMIDATALAKQFGKKVSDFLRLKRTKMQIEYIKEQHGGNIHEVLRVVRGGIPDRQGTWMCTQLALQFGKWLSVHFELWMYDLILGRYPKGISEMFQAYRSDRVRDELDEIKSIHQHKLNQKHIN